MVPTSLLRLLNRLRWRDRIQAIVWALGCGLACVLAAAVVAGLLDWLVDLWVDTPTFVGVIQVVLIGGALVGACVALIVSILRQQSDDELALWIEEKTPDLGQRLIAAVQLNRPEAKTQGMSGDLISAVTRQAERDAGTIPLSAVCDNRRLTRAVLVALPAVAIVALLGWAAPLTCAALLARLIGIDAEIPRSVRLRPTGRDVWPAGEEGTLRVLAVGKATPTTTGYAIVSPQTGSAFRVRLAYEGDSQDGAVYSGRVPPSDVPFSFRAWLADGRMHQSAEIRYAPRPVASSVRSWVMLPTDLLGSRPGGAPYEEPMKGGDLFHRLPGSQGRVAITAQTELSKAWLEVRSLRVAAILAANVAGSRSPNSLSSVVVAVCASKVDSGLTPKVVPMTVSGSEAMGTFPLEAGDGYYEVHLTDTNGFDSTDRTRRTIRQFPLEAPGVALLAETLWREGDSGSPEEREIEGIPILRTENPNEGRRFRMAYRCDDRYGLSRVRIRFRVVQAGKDAEAKGNTLDRDTFLTLPIGPSLNKKVRPTKKALEEFSTLATPDANAIPDTQGRGYYDFSIDGIPDGKGGYVPMKEGDRIQFYVEVFGKAAPNGPPGRSAVREKEVVGQSAYFTWMEKKDDLKERTRILEEQQRNVRPGQQ